MSMDCTGNGALDCAKGSLIQENEPQKDACPFRNKDGFMGMPRRSQCLYETNFAKINPKAI